MCAPADNMYSFTIEVLDLYTLDKTAHIPRNEDSTFPAVAVAAAGYIPQTPVNPSLAVSWATLELLRLFKNRCSSLSIETFAKVLCDLYKVRGYHKHNNIFVYHCTIRNLTAGKCAMRSSTPLILICQLREFLTSDAQCS